MKPNCLFKVLVALTIFLSSSLLATDFDNHRPEGIDDDKWSSLKMTIQESEIKLMPLIDSIDSPNPDSGFGNSVSFDGDRAVVGAYRTSIQGERTGAVYVFNFVDGTWTEPIVLVANDKEASDYFGYSVSLFGDRLVVGAYGDTDNGAVSGSVYVFDSNGSNWIQSAKLVATDTASFDAFGKSVSLSGDRFAVGAYGDTDNGAVSGSVYVFDFDGSNWIQSAKLLAMDGAARDQFGESISLSGDRLVIGSQYDDDNGTNLGSAYVFDFDGSNWNQSAKLLAGDGAEGDNFGTSVSLSGDRVVVGSPYYDFNTGAAYVFDFVGSNWIQSAKLVASDRGNSQFGYSLSLRYDRIVVGAPLNDISSYNSGSVYVFDLVDTNWLQSDQLFAEDYAAEDSFGTSVSLSPDGKILVGSLLDDDNGTNSGSAYLFDLVTGDYQQTDKLNSSVDSTGDNFGNSVSLSEDRFVVGSVTSDDNGTNSGSIYVFDFDGSNWNETKLVAMDGAAFDNFGNSVSLSGDRILVGSPYDDDNGTNSGSVYIFDFDGNNWIETKLVAGDGTNNVSFGNSVSLSGDRFLVGSYNDNDNGANSGSIYVFDFDGSNWNETKLVAMDGAEGDNFGTSVSLSEDRIVVGSYLDSDNGTNSGSAYVFDFDGSNWVQSAKLLAGDGTTGDRFGGSVSLSGDRIVVGSYLDSDNGPNSGSAYVFDFVGSNWIQSAKLVAMDGAAYDYFGKSVSLAGDKLVVGSLFDDDNGTSSGSAYVFDFDGTNWNETKLVAMDGAEGDKFGSSVSLFHKHVLVGVPSQDNNGIDSGGAYIYLVDIIFEDGFED